VATAQQALPLAVAASLANCLSFVTNSDQAHTKKQVTVCTVGNLLHLLCLLCLRILLPSDHQTCAMHSQPQQVELVPATVTACDSPPRLETRCELVYRSSAAEQSGPADVQRQHCAQCAVFTVQHASAASFPSVVPLSLVLHNVPSCSSPMQATGSHINKPDA
jgi:hypothetical protein